MASQWRTRDILIAAVIGVVFGVVFVAWQSVWGAFAFLSPSFLQDWVYGMWFVPGILAALVTRKLGAALFAETLASAVSLLLGSAWSVDAILSGVLQGAAAEAVFFLARYQSWGLPVLSAAAVASAVVAWAHDWIFYYADADATLQVFRLIVMALSAIVFAAIGSWVLDRSLRRAGVLETAPA